MKQQMSAIKGLVPGSSVVIDGGAGGESHVARVDDAITPPDPLSLEALMALVDRYETYTIRELTLADRLAQLEAATAEEEAYILADAEAAGAIEGKNAEARARQATLVLAESDVIREAREAAESLRTELAEVKALRMGAEMRLKVLRSWLYRESCMPEM
ncbi:MAG: hypothetical protein GX601_08010 [Anaerolineales bacterium]|nr:hypothetical protein [Anaerolineales bacterium]